MQPRPTLTPSIAPPLADRIILIQARRPAGHPGTPWQWLPTQGERDRDLCTLHALLRHLQQDRLREWCSDPDFEERSGLARAALARWAARHPGHPALHTLCAAYREADHIADALSPPVLRAYLCAEQLHTVSRWHHPRDHQQYRHLSRLQAHVRPLVPQLFHLLALDHAPPAPLRDRPAA